MVVENVSPNQKRGKLHETMRIALRAYTKRQKNLERVMHPETYDLLEGSDFGNPADRGVTVSPQNIEHHNKLNALLDEVRSWTPEEDKDTRDGLDAFRKDVSGMIAIRSRGKDSVGAAMAEVLAREQLAQDEPLPEREETNGDGRSTGDRIRRRDSS